MKNKYFTIGKLPGNLLQSLPPLIFYLVVFSLGGFKASSQIHYASSVVSESNVTSSNHSIDADQTTYSELEAGSGIIIGIGSYSSHIELQFPTVVPANQTSYVRIETEDNILSSLMGGTIGNLLSSIVGIALIGNQEFSVEAKSGATVVLSGSSTNPSSFSGEHLKVVVDANNHTYLAITPTQPYQSIRISNHVGSLIGLGLQKHMKVWDPYYVVQSANCVMPQFTSYDAAGLSLELLNLGGGVHNLERVIDGNLASHSTLSLGVVSVASTIVQRVYFEGVSQPADVFAVRLGIDPGLLAVTLGQGIRIRTQNGAIVVTNDLLQNVLTPADIALLQSGQPVTLYITPNAPIDRVVVEMEGLLGISVSQSLEVYEVYKISQSPQLDINGSDLIICEGGTAALIADAMDPADEIRWYESMNAATSIGITASGAPFITDVLHSDTVFYVASGVPGCPNESVRIPIAVDVIPGPDPTGITVPTFPQYCASDSVVLVAHSTYGTDFGWFLTPDTTAPVISGQQVGNHIYIVHNDSITIHGLSVADSPFSIYAGIQDTNTGCWSIPGDYAQITITIIDEPAPTTVSLEQSFCASELAVISDLQVNENVNWYSAPEGGEVLPSNTLLEDSVTYYASTIGAACESSERLEILVLINDEPSPTAAYDHQYFCVDDNPTLSDIEINGTVINWYDENGNSLPASFELVDGSTYYATNQGAECESSDSVAILISISELPAPTAENTVQVFCQADNPTIDDLVVNEAAIVWYDGDGNQLSPGTPLTDSAIYHAALVSPNCESDDRLEVLVVFENQYNVPLDGSVDNVCRFDTVIYSVPPGMSNYQWSVTGGVIVSGGSDTDNTITVVWQDSINTTIDVAYESLSGCLLHTQNPFEVNTVNCSDLIILKTVNNLHPFIGEEIVFTVTVTNTGQGSFSDVIVSEVIQDGFTYVSHQSTSGNYDQVNGVWTIPYLGDGQSVVLTITVVVNPTGNYSNVAAIISAGGNDIDTDNNTSEVIVNPDCLTIYNHISPNGDGVNDYFHIDCIEEYPDNSVTIYNRYGNVVYSTTGYQNDWNGVANVSGVFGKGEPLPVGTYYYLLKIEEKDFESSGWIYIVR